MVDDFNYLKNLFVLIKNIFGIYIQIFECLLSSTVEHSVVVRITRFRLAEEASFIFFIIK